ncbi:MAG TPA: FAD/NAD(P)-binding protein [Hyphomicrobiales bacterium]|nr:FAD/NAD(P)-binding protein [Hyphomicrobiales bacterium]
MSPSPLSPPFLRIAIVGGGLTGALLCLRLLRSRDGPFDIHLYEKTPARLCRGVAYSSSLPYQLLNVPAGQMSLFPEAPDDFLAWLRENGESPAAEAYVARHRFGDYVSARFEQAVRDNRRHRLSRIDAEVVDVVPTPEGLLIHTARGVPHAVAQAYLCTGNFPPADPPGLDPLLRQSGRYVAAPWDGRYLDRVANDATVLIIGTGLSMVDQALSLQRRPGFAGNVIALSRRGLLPLPHSTSAGHYVPAPFPMDDVSAKALYRWFAWEADKARQAGSDFQAVVEALRPRIPAIWNAFSAKERRRFLRHLRPLWEIHRHRIPDASATGIAALLTQERLRVIAGRVSALIPADAARIRLDYLPRAGTTRQSLVVDWVINCTGPQADHRQLGSPLYRALQERGLLTADASGLGFATTLAGQALRADGHSEPRLTLVGPPTKASLWESTALQEIRQQVQILIERLERDEARERRA